MGLQGDQLPAASVSDEEIEQVLLGLADGSYVLSTPDGAVAECGVGVVGLLGAPADRLVGRPTAEVLVPGADEAVGNAFNQLLHADGADLAAPRTFRAQTPGGTIRSLRFVVVAVPLALGWEFTSLLSELGSRDAGTWHSEALRLRHGRALEAIEGVVRNGHQPDPSARLAGILIVVRDVDAPALTREDVDRRMADQRDAARVAAAEAARRKDEAAGRAAHGPDATSVNRLPGLEDLVERARVLRERLEEAEHDAAAAKIERQDALGKLSHAEAERDAASARALSVQATGEGRVELLTGERDEARARVEEARRELDAARAEAEAARAELHAIRDAVHAERAAHGESADAELVAVRAQAEAAQTEADALHAELQSVRGELQAARGESALARGAAAAVRADLESARGELQDTRQQLDAARSELSAAPSQIGAVSSELDAVRTELHAARGKLDARKAKLEGARAELETRTEELAAARAELAARDAELLARRAELEARTAELQGRTDELHSRDAALRDRNAELEQRTGALHARDAALRDRNAELEQRTGALHARDDELRGARAELEAREHALAETRRQLAAARAEVDARGAALSAYDGELAGARAEVDDTRAELEAVRAELERTRSELETTAAAAADVLAEREQAKVRAQQLLGEAERARAAADAIRAEFAFDSDLDPAGSLGSALDGAPPARTAIPWRVPAPAAGAPAPPAGPRPALPGVAPGQAAALLSLDGQFNRLDDAFCALLGCREEELRAARWPSIIDRDNLKPHQEIARALKAGEIQSAEIETVYMHAQGLLVPIAGTISLHRADPAGEPTHFLFRADVSRTAGVPGVT